MGQRARQRGSRLYGVWTIDLVRGGRHEAIEGQWQPARIAMLRFPSYEQARAWYDSETYRQARRQRAGATEHFNMVLVEGVPAPV